MSTNRNLNNLRNSSQGNVSNDTQNTQNDTPTNNIQLPSVYHFSTTTSSQSNRNYTQEGRSFTFDGQSMRRRSSINETPVRQFRNIDDQVDHGSISMRRRRLLNESIETQHDTQYTQYGKTPLVIRRIRAARADIGDMGREFLMQDSEIERLPYIVDEEIDQVYERFTSFFYDFNPLNYPELSEQLDDINTNENHELSYYAKKLLKIVELANEKTFPVSLTHISLFDRKLYHLIVNYPADCICEIDKIVRKCFEKLSTMVFNITESSVIPKIVLFNKPEFDTSKLLGPKDIETLVSLKGIVLRFSNVIPEMTMAAFRCNGYKQSGLNRVACNNEIYEHVIQGDVIEPTLCKNCGSRNSFELVHNMCCFTSKQLIKLIELPEVLAKGQHPSSISLYAYDECIDAAKPGDRVEITGIFRASGVRINPRMRNLSTIFNTFINVLYIRKLDKNLVRVPAVLDSPDMDKEDQLNFPPELVSQIINLSRDKKIYEKLIKSLAPSIYGRDDVKMGLLCQLFGGSKNDKTRSDIHILLCGDPSTAKSQFLQYVHKLSHRGIYTSGKGSSQVGLTAYVSKDPDTREYILESGAVVLSDCGICCIDEFDKMNESARTVLHEVMEQQTVTIAKAGIVATLNARTAILASANPINSRYDRRRAVVENINLPPTLFSRFDLIYLIIDTANEVEDRALALSVCSNFSDTQELAPIDPKLFASYITFARAKCNPKLTPNAKEIIISEYLRLRSNDTVHTLFNGSSLSNKAPSASTRQLEALIRLSESIAKMRLSDTVEINDVQEATRLMKVATFASLIDPSSGKIDFDQLHIGQTLVNMDRIREVKSVILEGLSLQPISKEDLYKICQESLPQWFDYKLFDNAMFDLETSISITVLQNGLVKKTSLN